MKRSSATEQSRAKMARAKRRAERRGAFAKSHDKRLADEINRAARGKRPAAAIGKRPAKAQIRRGGNTKANSKQIRLMDWQAQWLTAFLANGRNIGAASRLVWPDVDDDTARKRGLDILRSVSTQRLIEKANEAEQRAALAVIDDYEVSEVRVKSELAKIAFANIGDFMVVGDDGLPTLDWSRLTREQKTVLAEVTVDAIGEKTQRVRFKMHDKMAALVALGRALAMFTDKQEQSGPGGVPLEPPKLQINFVRPVANEPPVIDAPAQSPAIVKPNGGR